MKTPSKTVIICLFLAGFFHTLTTLGFRIAEGIRGFYYHGGLIPTDPFTYLFLLLAIGVYLIERKKT